MPDLKWALVDVEQGAIGPFPSVEEASTFAGTYLNLSRILVLPMSDPDEWLEEVK